MALALRMRQTACKALPIPASLAVWEFLPSVPFAAAVLPETELQKVRQWMQIPTAIPAEVQSDSLRPTMPFWWCT